MGAAAAYGFVRKVPLVWNGEVREFDMKLEYKQRPLLVTEKVFITLCSTICAPYIAPIWIGKDLLKAEVTIRHLDPDTYNINSKMNNIIEYIFA